MGKDLVENPRKRKTPESADEHSSKKQKRVHFTANQPLALLNTNNPIPDHSASSSSTATPPVANTLVQQQSHTFEKTPKEVHQITSKFLSDAETRNLGLLNKYLAGSLKESMEKRGLIKLIQAIMLGDPKTAKAIVSAQPHLLFKKWQEGMTDPSGRTFEPTTALQLILWLQEPMRDEILACIPENRTDLKALIDLQKKEFMDKGLNYTFRDEAGVIQPVLKSVGYSLDPIISTLKSISSGSEDRYEQKFFHYGKLLRDVPYWIAQLICGDGLLTWDGERIRSFNKGHFRAPVRIIVTGTNSSDSWFGSDSRLGVDLSLTWIASGSGELFYRNGQSMANEYFVFLRFKKIMDEDTKRFMQTPYSEATSSHKRKTNDNADEPLSKRPKLLHSTYPSISQAKQPSHPNNPNLTYAVSSSSSTTPSNVTIQNDIDNEIDALLHNVNLYAASEFSTTLTTAKTLSFASLIQQFKDISRYKISTPGRQEKQRNIFIALKSKARTAEDYYLLSMALMVNPVWNRVYGINFTQLAASAGHMFSMRIIAGCALSGFFIDTEASVRWALECIRYLEKIGIPKLKSSNQSSEDLVKITEGLQRARKRIGAIGFKEEIPAKDGAEYKQLLQSTIQRITTQKSAPPHYDFLLSETMFKALEAGNQLIPIQLTAFSSPIYNSPSTSANNSKLSIGTNTYSNKDKPIDKRVSDALMSSLKVEIASNSYEKAVVTCPPTTSFFQKTPNDILLHMAKFFPDASASNFAVLNKFSHSIYKPKLQERAVIKLMQAIMTGDPLTVKTITSAQPDLLFQECQVTDSAGRTFKNTNGAEQILWSKEPMRDEVFACIPKNRMDLKIQIDTLKKKLANEGLTYTFEDKTVKKSKGYDLQPLITLLSTVDKYSPKKDQDQAWLNYGNLLRELPYWIVQFICNNNARIAHDNLKKDSFRAPVRFSLEGSTTQQSFFDDSWFGPKSRLIGDRSFSLYWAGRAGFFNPISQYFDLPLETNNFFKLNEIILQDTEDFLQAATVEALPGPQSVSCSF